MSDKVGSRHPVLTGSQFGCAKLVVKVAVVCLAVALGSSAMAANRASMDPELQLAAYEQAMARSDYRAAVQIAEGMLDARARRRAAKGKADARSFLAHVHLANALRWNGQWDLAIEQLDQAELVIKDYETRALGIGGLEAVGATLIGNNVKRYRPKASDGILVNTYKAIGFLALGRSDDARVELHRSDERTRRAVESYAREIENERRKEQKNAAQRAVDGHDGEVVAGTIDSVIQENYPELAHWKVYEDFVNPYTVYMHALFFFAAGHGASDVEAATGSMKRMVGMYPDSAQLADDLDLMERVASGHTPRTSVEQSAWIICEDGVGPELGARNVDFAIPLDGQIVPLRLVLPELHAGTPGEGGCGVRVGNEVHFATEIASMDRVAQTEFKKRLPREAAQSIAGMLVRGAVQTKLQEQGGMVGAALGMLYQKKTATTETRGWHALPRAWYAIRVSRPADGRIDLVAPDGGMIAAVDLPATQFSIVHVRSPAAGAASVTAIAAIGAP